MHIFILKSKEVAVRPKQVASEEQNSCHQMSSNRHLKVLLCMSIVTTALCVILLVYGASKKKHLERTDLKDFRRFHLLDNLDSQDPEDPWGGFYFQIRLQENVSINEVSIQPSSLLSSARSAQSSSLNSSTPSGQPSSSPSLVPSSLPSSQPSFQPSSQPTSVPSSSDTSAPTGQSSLQPTHKPSIQEISMVNKSSQNDRKVSDGGVVGIFFACLIFIGAIGGAAHYYKYRKIYNPLNEPNKGKKSQLLEDDFVLHSFYN